MSNPFQGKANNGTGSTETPEAGTHPGVLVALIDLGSHEEEYQGVKKTQRKALLVWELTAEKQTGSDNNHLVSKEYTISYHKKGAIRQLCESIRGKPYGEDEEIDYLKLLGQPCLITVEVAESSSGNKYAKVKAVTRPAKGMTVPKPKRKPSSWFVDGVDLSGLEAISWLPYLYGERVADVVKRSHEYRGARSEGKGPQTQDEGEVPAGVGDADDTGDIPF